MKCIDIEIAIAKHFGYRTNIIVPQVSWGLGLNHEADLLVVSPAGCVREIEIKVSASDIKADLAKRHPHGGAMIRQVYFAVPEELAGNPNIPSYCGILSVHEMRKSSSVTCVRAAKVNPRARKLSPREIQHLLHLGCMRLWSLKQKLQLERVKYREAKLNLL